MRVPAICDSCGTIFPSSIDVGDNIHVSFTGTLASPCPACGNVGHIPDGMYHFIGRTIELLSGPSRSYEELARLGSLLKDAIGNKRSPEQISDEIKKEVPDLYQLSDILPKTRAEFYSFVNIVLIIIGLLVSYNASKSRPDIKIEQVINVVYNQEIPSTKQQVIKPESKKVVSTKPKIKQKKIGRNDKCPCGSGKKYKFCCIKKG